MDHVHTGGIGHGLHVIDGLANDLAELNFLEGQALAAALEAFEVEVLGSLPVFATVIGLQRYLIRGIGMGAVKG